MHARLGRFTYDAHSQSVAEYYTISHDVPEAQVKDLEAFPRNKVCVLFGGIGDARHLYQTVISLGRHVDRMSPDRCFHFTVVDLKAAAIARDLLVMLMLDELSRLEGKARMRSGIPHTLYYTYLAPMMPKFCYDRLHIQIRGAIDALEGRQQLPSFIHVPVAFRADIIRILKEWQTETWETFPTSRIRKSMYQYPMSRTGLLDSCRKQESFFIKTGVLMMAPDADRLIATELLELCEAYSRFRETDSPALNDDVLSSLDATWATNVTMVDLEYERGREKTGGMDIDIGNNPFEFGGELEEAKTLPPDPYHGLFEYASAWFLATAKALAEMKHRMTIEICVGDVTAIAEQIHYGVVGHRTMEHPLTETENNVGKDEPGPAGESSKNPQKGSGTTPKERSYPELDDHPKLYDRIHLSNIPDYIGGSLPIFLLALPLVWPDTNSFATSNCLRNPNRWKTAAHYNNEYLCLHRPSDLEKVFRVKMKYDDPYASLPGPRLPMDYEMVDYHHWYHQPKSQNFDSLTDLMPRQPFETWLYRLFLKLSIPAERRLDDYYGHIYTPLNLTMYIRLCIHLHRVGYPAHWISGVLDGILSGKITTKARPPRSEPLKIQEVKADMSQLKQSTGPLVAELSTLISMWQCAIPFGILALNLPLLQDIRKYSFAFRKAPDGAMNANPTCVVVFFNAANLPHRTNIRPYLLDDEVADCPIPMAVREKSLHVITTWMWDRENLTASFWMRRDVVEDMKKGQWRCALWRTDNWRIQSPVIPIEELRDSGLSWSET